MKKFLVLLFLFLTTPAYAQNILCQTRGQGDATNACASTSFVDTYIKNVSASFSATIGALAVNGDVTGLLGNTVVGKIGGVPVATIATVPTALNLSYTAPFSHSVLVSQQTQNSAIVTPVSWGADPTCTADSTSAFNKMFGDIGPGTTIDIGYGCYRVGTVTQPQNTMIRGAMGYGDPFLSASAGGVQINPYTWGGEIRRIQGTTWTATNGDRFSNIVFIREGLLPTGVTFPLQSAAQASAVIANYGDNAITSDTASIDIDHSTFLGFNFPIQATNNGGIAISNKVRFTFNLVDGNNGPYAASSGDPHIFLGNHIFPFLTIAAPGVGTGTGQSSAPMQRSGVGIYLVGPDTGTRVSMNLEFGYAIGLQCSTACSSIDVSSNRFENIGGSNAVSGISVAGQYLQVHNNKVIGYTYPVRYDGTGFPVGTNTFILKDNFIVAPSPSAYCFDQYAGTVLALGNLFQNCVDGVHVESGSTGGQYTGNNFVGVTNQFVYYNSSGSVVGSYAGTGILVIKDNLGYNPVGPKGVTVSTGTFTYTAGPSPEVIYLWSGTVSGVSVNGRGIFVNPTGQTISLAPNETMTITSSAAPTMVSDVQ